MRNSTVCLSITLLGLIHWPALALSSKCSTNICRLSLQSALTSGCQGHVMTEGPNVCLHLLSSSYTMLLCARENSSLPESLQWIIQTGGLRTNARKSEYWHHPAILRHKAPQSPQYARDPWQLPLSLHRSPSEGTVCSPSLNTSALLYSGVKSRVSRKRVSCGKERYRYPFTSTIRLGWSNHK